VQRVAPRQVTLQAACGTPAKVNMFIKGQPASVQCNGLCSDSVHWFHIGYAGYDKTWWLSHMAQCGVDMLSVWGPLRLIAMAARLQIAFIQLWTGEGQLHATHSGNCNSSWR
jgi:hypothetical protein